MARGGGATFWDESLARGQAAARRDAEAAATAQAQQQEASRRARQEAEAAVGMAPETSPISPSTERIVRDHLAAQAPGERIVVKVPQDPELQRMADETDAALAARGFADPNPAGIASEAAAAGRDARSTALLNAQSMAEGRSVVPTPNPMYEPVQDYLGATRDAAGRERAATVAGQDAEAEGARALQAYYIDERARLHAENAAREDVEFTRQAQASAALEASRKARLDVTKAAEALQAAPDEDPERYWADQSAGRKALWAISAGLLGFAGMDPFAHLQSAISADIAAQRSNRDLLRTRLDARQQQAGQARSVYEQLSSEFADQRAVDLGFENARLNEAKARFAKMQADAGVAMLEPTQQQFLAQIDQRIAENELQLDQMAARNPENFTRVVSNPNVRVLGPDGRTYVVPRAVAAQLVGADIKQSEALQTQAVGVAAQGARDASEARSKAAEAQQRGERVSAENARFIAKETAKARRVRQLAQDLLDDVDQNDGDVPGVSSVHIPGVGAPTHSLTARARDFRRRLDILREYDVTDITGAVAAPDQVAAIEAFLSGNEESVVTGLREMQRAMDSYINTFEAADPEAAAAIREHSDKAERGGWRGARVDAPAGASSVVEEDE